MKFETGLMAACAVMALSAPAVQAQDASATGTVRRVDAAQGSVTLQHGEIAALQLPAMTLVYQADPALLQNLKPGDAVRFNAVRRDGRYVVTAIEKAAS